MCNKCGRRHKNPTPTCPYGNGGTVAFIQPAPTAPGPEARTGKPAEVLALSNSSDSWTPEQMLAEVAAHGELLPNALLLEFGTDDGGRKSLMRARYAGPGTITDWLGIIEREKFDLLMSRFAE